jgi:hypothetical protein
MVTVGTPICGGVSPKVEYSAAKQRYVIKIGVKGWEWRRVNILMRAFYLATCQFDHEK